MEKTMIKECPECGSIELDIRISLGELLIVRCPVCGISGRPGRTTGDAIDLWNAIERKEQNVPRPGLMPGLIIDSPKIRNACKKYVDAVAGGGYVDEDHDHWIFEAAMEAVYGKGIWEWIRENS